MADMIPALVGVAVICLVGGLIWWTRMKEREQAQEREQRAMERGWAYRSGAVQDGVGWAVTGSEGGFEWTLEVSRPRGKNQGTRAAWRVPGAPCAAGAVWMGSSAMLPLFKSPLGRKLVGWGLKLAASSGKVGSEAESLLERGVEIDLGDPDFAHSYGVLATDSGSAFQVLNPGVRQSMLAWEDAHRPGSVRGSLGLTWGPDGLAVNWSGRVLTSGDDMTSFVEMGLVVLKALRGGW
jgi:hypothetical protein